MNKISFLFSVVLGTFVYVFFSVCLGQNGIWASLQIEQQKNELTIKFKELEKQNTELLLRHQALMYDRDVISAYARKIGFVADNEKIVKISGLPHQFDAIQSVGTPYFKTPIKFVPEWICKLFGLILFCVFEFLFSFKKILKKDVGYRKGVENNVQTA